MANTIEAQLLMMNALSQAEQLAHANPQQHAVIYRKINVAEAMNANTGGWSLFVRLASEPAPEGAELLTTVSRKPPDGPGNSLSVGGAVRHVLKNLP